ncbi:hypothetical protein GCM10011390_41540 [Aureimonas endophytica]|uniref:Uncharacterized protein n=1 Tax=Aureimonas endophytica TaxID=2027858 RepID=A0A916ZXJ2_9HYPH|nr:hypothetical protein [Aureimonas endophytica]GGE18052.1 hypothetical protein GCM10011390_41540 [Aureimonas endophytica]
MSNSPLNDDDTLMAFKAKGDGRQRAFPVSWKTLKSAILALVPASQDFSPAIAAEQKARATADSTLSDAVAAEAQKRAAGDQASADAIAAEAKARADAVSAEAKARGDADAALGTRVKAIEDKPLIRIERYTGVVTGSAGLATIDIAKPFTAPPIGAVVTTWVGSQMITGTVTATMKSSAIVQVMKSVATVLIGASPFGVAPAGTPVTIELIGY